MSVIEGIPASAEAQTFPATPQVAWNDLDYVAPPTFVDNEPDGHKPIALEVSSHLESLAQDGVNVNERPIEASSPPLG